MIKKVSFSFLYVMFFVMVSNAFAHVKWFTEKAPEKPPLDEILTPLFIGIVLLIAIVLGFLTQIIGVFKKYSYVQKINGKLDGIKGYAPMILRYGTALSLVLQLSSHSIIAPEIHLSSLAFYVSIVIIIALLVPFHYSHKLAAILLLFVFGLCVNELGWFYMLDYGFYIAIAVSIFLQKTKLQHIGMPSLYLGTGLSLCWVAVEKWVFPNMSTDIVVNHGVPTFGFEPSIFIMLSAFIEFVVGYLMVVGVLNRLLGLVVTIIFVLTTTIFGATEIVGHFIVHVILLIFIIEDTSFYNPPIEMHKRKIDQIVFVFLNFIFVLSTFLLIYYRFS